MEKEFVKRLNNLENQLWKNLNELEIALYANGHPILFKLTRNGEISLVATDKAPEYDETYFLSNELGKRLGATIPASGWWFRWENRHEDPIYTSQVNEVTRDEHGELTFHCTTIKKNNEHVEKYDEEWTQAMVTKWIAEGLLSPTLKMAFELANKKINAE